MQNLLHTWPWWGLAGAVGLLALLAMQPADDGSPRMRDPRWLLKLAWPLYMVHQFEEHGIDLLGRHYAFQEEMCATLGYAHDLLHCPADPAFLMAVNVGAVWIAGALAWASSGRRQAVGAAAVSLLFVNGVLHIGSALHSGRYNPGLATSLVLFLPYGIWTLLQLVRNGVLRPIQLVPVMLCGVAMHGILMASAIAEGRGLIPETPVLILQVLNGFLPLLFGATARQLRSAPASSAPT